MKKGINTFYRFCLVLFACFFLVKYVIFNGVLDVF